MKKYSLLLSLHLICAHAQVELPVKFVNEVTTTHKKINMASNAKNKLPINSKTMAEFIKKDINFAKENKSLSSNPKVLPVSKDHVNVIHTPFMHPKVVSDQSLSGMKKEHNDIYFIAKHKKPIHVFIYDALHKIPVRLSLLLIPKSHIAGFDYDFSNDSFKNNNVLDENKENHIDQIVNDLKSFILRKDHGKYFEVDIRENKVLGCEPSRPDSILIKDRHKFNYRNKTIIVTRFYNNKKYAQDLKMIICDSRNLLAAVLLPNQRISPHGETTLYVLRKLSYKGIK